ncbi:MAG: hypothetical protein J5956_07370 [Ruminococcus sp.]|nr:hypothetical protein [Ruminococcus sp.]
MKNTEKRTLAQLRDSFEGHIYLHFGSEAEYEAFLVEAENEGFRFGERLPHEFSGSWHDIVALTQNKGVCFCNTFSRMAYQCGGDNVLRVEYAKYAGGEEEYII